MNLQNVEAHAGPRTFSATNCEITYFKVQTLLTSSEF